MTNNRIKIKIKAAKLKIKTILSKYKSLSRLKKYHAKYTKVMLKKSNMKSSYEEGHANYVKIIRLSKCVDNLVRVKTTTDVHHCSSI